VSPKENTQNSISGDIAATTLVYEQFAGLGQKFIDYALQYHIDIQARDLTLFYTSLIKSFIVRLIKSQQHHEQLIMMIQTIIGEHIYDTKAFQQLFREVQETKTTNQLKTCQKLANSFASKHGRWFKKTPLFYEHASPQLIEISQIQKPFAETNDKLTREFIDFDKFTSRIEESIDLILPELLKQLKSLSLDETTLVDNLSEWLAKFILISTSTSAHAAFLTQQISIILNYFDGYSDTEGGVH